ncbi:MAG TPA: fibronectin type III domain-containing protein, partial [Thermoanaerobaculia bacterium]|nr:fibronectin type III domain-containing protein [Thermoanaerobaculia bacterium]
TLAAGNVGGTDESTWLETSILSSALVAGTNTVAVEVHQEYSGSSDMSFALAVLGVDDQQTPNVRRGPYLQLGTPTSVVVRWRTDLPSASRVRYGTTAGNLTSFVDDGTVTTDHSVTLTGLSPYTKYYYSIGTPTATIAGDSSYTFHTAPQVGTAVPTQIWVLGDSGTGDGSARAVRNAYYNFAGSNSTNLWLMLGDNAYDYGTDAEYQLGVFDMYPEMLRSSVLWPTIGNHDTAGSYVYSPSIPYYDIFTLPTRGEAGGVASGSESYYSFDYGNIHFVCLDSMTSDRSSTGPMLTWLRNDLASTRQPWIIAFWHHPPYSKGGHDSDVVTPLIDMRRNALPILEEAGVDLVLSGHSHSYERSYLIDSHYGYSNTFVSSMKRNGGDGRVDGNGAYRKSSPTGSHEGAVYAVAGSSGMASGNGPLNHPAMYISLMNLGSMVLEIRGNTLDAKFLRENGVVADSFRIVKGAPTTPPAAPTSNLVTATTDKSITLRWNDNASDEDGFRVERCSGTACTNFAQVGETTVNTTTYTDGNLSASTLYRYRVSAYNAAGASSPTNVAESTTHAAQAAPAAPASLTATATSTSQISLAWTDTANNEEGMQVERCTGAACTDFTLLAVLPANTAAFNDSSLNASTLYRYRVFAFNATGPSTFSNVAEATTQTPITTPNAPSSLTATAVSTTQINLAWTDGSANETGFRIERCSGASCTTFVQIAETPSDATSYSDATLAHSTLYRYRVLAYNTAGAAPSNVAEATTQAHVATPGAPGNLTATATSSSQISLAWADNSGNEDGFRVERCDDLGCTNFLPVAQTAANATTFVDSALRSSTLYRYRVQSFNSAGATPSNIAEATTPVQPTAPATANALTATAFSSSQIRLNWNDVSSNEDGFRIERCSGASCTAFAVVGQTAANATTFSDTGLTGATLYRYRVIAFNSVGGAPSNVAEATTPAEVTTPAAPSALSATATSASQISLAWTDASGNEDGFRVERCAGAGCTNFAQIAQTLANVNSYGDTQLSGSTIYRYRVLAYNSAGAAASNVAEATTPAAVTIPAAAANVIATSISASQINLTWSDSSANEDGFRIERCTGAGCTSFTLIAQPAANATSYSNTGLAASTVYRYRVVAFNSAGGNPSSVAEATTKAAMPAPAAPTNLSATISGTNVVLRWVDASTNEEGFRIERCTGAACTNFTLIAQVGANSSGYSNPGVAASTTYRYRVNAFNAGGSSPYSNIVDVTTPAPAPAAPTSLAVTAMTSTYVSLGWTDASTNETGFRVQRCTGASCTGFVQIAEVGANVTAYRDSTVSASTVYRYRVFAFNNTGNSTSSNIIQITTPAPTTPAAPTALNSTVTSGSSLTLSWTDNATNESGFGLERCAGSSCTNFTQFAQVGANVSSFNVTGLHRNTYYRFRVRAFNAAGGSAYTNV